MTGEHVRSPDGLDLDAKRYQLGSDGYDTKARSSKEATQDPRGL